MRGQGNILEGNTEPCLSCCCQENYIDSSITVLYSTGSSLVVVVVVVLVCLQIFNDMSIFLQVREH